MQNNVNKHNTHKNSFISEPNRKRKSVEHYQKLEEKSECKALFNVRIDVCCLLDSKRMKFWNAEQYALPPLSIYKDPINLKNEIQNSSSEK